MRLTIADDAVVVDYQYRYDIQKPMLWIFSSRMCMDIELA